MIDTEKQLNADFDAWFAQLAEIAPDTLNPEDWTEAWFDGYSPAQAWAENARNAE